MTPFSKLLVENTMVRGTTLYHASRIPVTGEYLKAGHTLWLSKNKSQAGAWAFMNSSFGAPSTYDPNNVTTRRSGGRPGDWSIYKVTLKRMKFFDATRPEKYKQLLRNSPFDDALDELDQYVEFLIQDATSTEVKAHDFTRFLQYHGFNGVQIEEDSFIGYFSRSDSIKQHTLCLFDTRDISKFELQERAFK